MFPYSTAFSRKRVSELSIIIRFEIKCVIDGIICASLPLKWLNVGQACMHVSESSAMHLKSGWKEMTIMALAAEESIIIDFNYITRSTEHSSGTGSSSVQSCSHVVNDVNYCEDIVMLGSGMEMSQ